MSGINTLVDTLLHQVLGKRIDTPQPRELNQPVKPMTPADAPSAVRSDSRLDHRINAPLRGTSQTAREPPGARLGRQPAGERLPQPSAETRFTPSARSIADLHLRFPAAPSALRLSQPLLPTDEAQAPRQVAQQLQHSVRDSGLFYESHLSRWFRGELSREQLQREPQMWRPLTFASSPTDQSSPAPLRSSWPAFVLGLRRGGEPILNPERGQPSATGSSAGSTSGRPGVVSAPAGAGGGPNPTGSAFTPAGSTVQVAQATAQASAAEAREGAAERAANAETAIRMARAEARQPIHESLQGIVRHQLELLATPVLRWEGDVWSGIFMALMVQPPAARREEGGSLGEGEEQNRDESQEWQSSMVLQVSGLGEVGVKLWLSEVRLELELSARDPAVHTALAQGIDQLRSRLEAYELSQVLVRLRAAVPEAEPEASGAGE